MSRCLPSSQVLGCFPFFHDPGKPALVSQQLMAPLRWMRGVQENQESSQILLPRSRVGKEGKKKRRREAITLTLSALTTQAINLSCLLLVFMPYLSSMLRITRAPEVGLFSRICCSYFIFRGRHFFPLVFWLWFSGKENSHNCVLEAKGCGSW